MDLQALLDMNYFWWVFNKIAGFGMPFLVIFVAIAAAGFLIHILVGAFKSMRKG